MGTACTTLVLTKKIPSLLCCFSKPHLNIWHTQGKGGWEDKYEVKKYHRCSSAWTPSPLQPSCSIWPLWPPFFSSLSLHIRQTTPSNLISVATCKGLPRRLPVNRVWVDTVQIQATLEPSWPVVYTQHPDFWLLTTSFFSCIHFFASMCVCLFMQGFLYGYRASCLCEESNGNSRVRVSTYVRVKLCVNVELVTATGVMVAWRAKTQSCLGGAVTHGATQRVNSYCQRL